MSESAKKRKRRGERKDGRIQVTATIGIDNASGKAIRKSFSGIVAQKPNENELNTLRQCVMEYATIKRISALTNGLING